jgi:hypothetical protein
MRSIITVFSIFVLIAVSFSGAEAAQKKFNQTFQVTPGGKLTVETDRGSIHVAGTSDNAVSVAAEIEERDKDVVAFEITANQQGNDVVVHGKEEKHVSWPWNWSFSSKLRVNYTIQVPRQFMLHLNTSGGDVNISTVEGSISGNTSGGNVDITSVKGDVEFSTSGGNITVEKSSGIIRTDTSGGNIDVTDATGIIEVNTSGGNIKINAAEGAVRAKTSGGSVFVNVKGENKGVNADTMGGSIMLEVPKNIAANIEADTLGGGVRCDLPVTISGRLDKSRINGTINGGGALIHAHTLGGNIWIKGVE